MKFLALVLLMSICGCQNLATDKHDLNFVQPKDLIQNSNNTLSFDNNDINDFQFNLPNFGWATGAPAIDNTATKAVLFNKQSQNLILIGKEKFIGLTYDYATSAIHALDSKDGSVILLGNELLINNQGFYLALFKAENSSIFWIWFTSKNNFAYSFSCGGKPSLENERICKIIANTIILK